MKIKLLILLLAFTMVGCASPEQEERKEQTELEDVYKDREGYHSRDWDGDDSKCLAQLASYITWDCDLKAKTTIINIAINRVWADGYPGSIEEVVSGMTGGLYIYEQPDDECWKAENDVQIEGIDYSDGATEFEIVDGRIILE